METMQASKTVLRQEIKKKIAGLSQETKNKQSENVVTKLFHLKQFQESRRVSVYLSTENEVDTTKILKRIFDEDKSCFIPRYNRNVMEMVRLKSMDDYEKLPLTKWNIKQPELNEIRENAVHTGGLDLIIVPGVAFTKCGKRLGHGKGYYDKFLNNFNKKPLTIGLAFMEQIIDDIPTDKNDFVIDTVLYSEN